MYASLSHHDLLHTLLGIKRNVWDPILSWICNGILAYLLHWARQIVWGRVIRVKIQLRFSAVRFRNHAVLLSYFATWSACCGLMYQSIPKPPISPAQSPGIWLALSSVQWGIWPKMRPARWGIWLRVKTSVSGRKQKDGELRSRVIALVDYTWVFLLLSFYIVLSWNMPCLKCGAKTSWTRNS